MCQSAGTWNGDQEEDEENKTLLPPNVLTACLLVLTWLSRYLRIVTLIVQTNHLLGDQHKEGQTGQLSGQAVRTPPVCTFLPVPSFTQRRHCQVAGYSSSCKVPVASSILHHALPQHTPTPIPPAHVSAMSTQSQAAVSVLTPACPRDRHKRCLDYKGAFPPTLLFAGFKLGPFQAAFLLFALLSLLRHAPERVRARGANGAVVLRGVVHGADGCDGV